MKVVLILAALVTLRVPAQVFWLFAAWECRMWTALENALVGRKGGGR